MNWYPPQYPMKPEDMANAYPLPVKPEAAANAYPFFGTDRRARSLHEADARACLVVAGRMVASRCAGTLGPRAEGELMSARCPKCGGTGVIRQEQIVPASWYSEGVWAVDECEDCEGTGKVVRFDVGQFSEPLVLSEEGCPGTLTVASVDREAGVLTLSDVTKEGKK